MPDMSDAAEGHEQQPVRCPICGADNLPMQYCRHVRWTFDQGGPLDFAHFAMETSPYVTARGRSARDIPKPWWDAHADWIVDQVLFHFDASDGYVFGELARVDLLARDVWKEFHPDPIRPAMARQ
jgi:hypothetical protein